MLAKEIKTGAVVNYQDAPHAIESVTVQTPSARGAATLYKYRARNLLTRQKVDIALKGTESLDEADFTRRPCKYLYADATHLHFMDEQDFNQYALSKEDCTAESPYLTEELEGVLAMIYNDACIGIQVPTAVALKIIECAPGVKGNSATSRTKSARLETGLEIQVPEYLKQDEVVKVDTRTGQYLSRA